MSIQEVEVYYELAIADSGSGLAPEYHDKIWVTLHRLEARDKVEETRIRLSVVKKIVESRGGQVWVESVIGARAAFALHGLSTSRSALSLQD